MSVTMMDQQEWTAARRAVVSLLAALYGGDPEWRNEYTGMQFAFVDDPITPVMDEFSITQEELDAVYLEQVETWEQENE